MLLGRAVPLTRVPGCPPGVLGFGHHELSVRTAQVSRPRKLPDLSNVWTSHGGSPVHGERGRITATLAHTTQGCEAFGSVSISSGVHAGGPQAVKYIKANLPPAIVRAVDFGATGDMNVGLRSAFQRPGPRGRRPPTPHPPPTAAERVVRGEVALEPTVATLSLARLHASQVPRRRGGVARHRIHRTSSALSLKAPVRLLFASAGVEGDVRARYSGAVFVLRGFPERISEAEAPDQLETYTCSISRERGDVCGPGDWPCTARGMGVDAHRLIRQDLGQRAREREQLCMPPCGRTMPDIGQSTSCGIRAGEQTNTSGRLARACAGVLGSVHGGRPWRRAADKSLLEELRQSKPKEVAEALAESKARPGQGDVGGSGVCRGVVCRRARPGRGGVEGNGAPRLRGLRVSLEGCCGGVMPARIQRKCEGISLPASSRL